MEYVRSVIDWFAGGDGDQQYMDLMHCMNHDTVWIIITVVLDLAVAFGYVMIAYDWWRNQRTLEPGPSRRALGKMRNIFVFCGICGYIFIPIKMFWPAWRLYDLFMLVLVYFTWSYAWRAKELRVVYQELNERKQLEVDLTHEREVSRKKSFFLSAVGHDLRTPLTGMMLQARLAEKRLDRNDIDAVREGLDDIRTLANEANTLLSEFLEMGRLDSESMPVLEITAQPVSSLLEHVYEIFDVQARANGIDLKVESPLDDLIIHTDREKLQRVLNNLVGNAIKFTQQGRVKVSASVDGDDVIFEVSDTGPGIEEAHLARLFDEFYQVENRERDRQKGFGLGLAIARRLTGRLGGRLTVTSELGVGSQFKVFLPQTGPDVD